MNQHTTSKPRPAARQTRQERAALARLREKAERALERLLAVLDAITPDPDLEAEPDDEAGGDDEPSLASPNATVGRTMLDGVPPWPQQTAVFDAGIDQTNWARGSSYDMEDEHDGHEPDVDDEDGGDSEDAEGGSYGTADKDDAEGLIEELAAFDARKREHELTNPARQARALLKKHGLADKRL